MKDLYIVGAGGCGREVLHIIKDIHRIQGPRWNIMGFLDDTEDPLKGKECDYGVVGTIQGYQPKDNDVLVMAIASPQAKQKLVPMLLERGAVFETVIHPRTDLGEFNSIGKGVVIYPDFGMTVNVKIGDYVTLLCCGIGHDVKVGNFATISGTCQLLGGAVIGDRAFLGCGSTILPHAVVENDTYVGAGSVVLRRVKAGKRVFGNPAREMFF
ncbi:NeuD/PglB/VioB family sugar acetyltransferase [Oscillospiraceae bacterium 42-9]